MKQARNPYCERLGIEVPSLAAVHSHPDANTYALLIVALLQRGRPMTLAEVALEFQAAGLVEHADDASIPTMPSSTCGPSAWACGRRGSHGLYRLRLRRGHSRASRSASTSSIAPGVTTPT
jgi:hypothetical protein